MTAITTEDVARITSRAQQNVSMQYTLDYRVRCTIDVKVGDLPPAVSQELIADGGFTFELSRLSANAREVLADWLDERTKLVVEVKDSRVADADIEAEYMTPMVEHAYEQRDDEAFEESRFVPLESPTPKPLTLRVETQRAMYRVLDQLTDGLDPMDRDQAIGAIVRLIEDGAR